MGVVIKHKGDFKNTERFLKNAADLDIESIMAAHGPEGCRALAAATPTRSGMTARSWNYEVTSSRGACVISWYNTNVNKGFNIAIGLQYGHGTGTGGWVSGADYINPAVGPVFDKIARSIWEEVRNL